MQKLNPNTAALLSFIIPGAGYVYAGFPMRGVFWFLLWAVFIGLSVYMLFTTGSWWFMLIIAVAIWIFGIRDTRKIATYVNELGDN